MIRNHSEWHLSEITTDELFDHFNSDSPPTIFDTRSTQEFNGKDGHIPNSLSLPIRKISSNLKDPLSHVYDYKEKEVVTLCPGGGLSLIAVDILTESGFQNVKSLNGGLDMWREKGYPIITTKAEGKLSPDETSKPDYLEDNAKIAGGKQSIDEESPHEVHHTLDVRNLSCPIPVLKSRKTLKTLKKGQVLEILTTDPGSQRDIPAWAQVTGQELVLSEELGSEGFRFLVKRMK